MKVTVLGGSGFIGSHLADRLVDGGHEVTLFHAAGGSRKNIAHLCHAIRVLEGDFANASDIAQAVAGAEIVAHLVCSTVPGKSLFNPIYDLETNVAGSLSLFEACVGANVKKLVFLSSGGTVYGIPESIPIKESHPLNPISPYGISKLAIEKYLYMFHYQYGLDYSILRISNPYGERQDPNKGQGVIATWVQQVLDNQPIEIWGDGSVVRDYIDIHDVIEAIYLSLFKNSEHKVFNVGAGKGQSLMDLHRIMEVQVGREIPVNYRPGQRVDVPVNVLDTKLIRNTLQWEPKIGIEDGIKRLIDYRKHLGNEANV